MNTFFFAKKSQSIFDLPFKKLSKNLLEIPKVSLVREATQIRNDWQAIPNNDTDNDNDCQLKIKHQKNNL